MTSKVSLSNVMARMTTTTALLTVLTSLLPLLHASAAMDFRAMEDNCILSFVVPRDKVKSSCDMEERVTRRLNAMETKVTLYKQHVQELQEQLAKERQAHTHRLQEINQRLAANEFTDTDGHGALGKRIQALEEEIRKIKSLTSSSSFSKDSLAPSSGEKANGRGAGGAGEVSQAEADKARVNLVKSVVHSEVKRLFDNYTQYVGRYVRDQALAFNQIINMVPRNDQSFTPNNIPPHWPNTRSRGTAEQGVAEKAGASPTPLPPDRADLVLLKELEGIRQRLNTTSRHLADRVQNVLKNVTAPRATPPPSLPSTLTDSAPRDPEVDTSLLEVNDTSASGETNDTASDHNITFTFTTIDNNISAAAAADTTGGDSPHKNVQVAGGSDSGGKEGASSAKSRMSYNADLNKLPDPTTAAAAGSGDSDRGRDREEESRTEGGAGGQWAWSEGMVHDEGRAQWVQQVLRTEVQQVLQRQVEEVLSLVSKHSALLDTKLSDQQRQFNQLEERITADIKHLDQVVSGLKLELTSVSQGLQTLSTRADKMEELERTVLELKKNVSMEGNNRLLATLLDEQGKKVRKMERLTDIYKQSLEHYRNETKLEYRDLKERLSKEVTVLRGLNTDLFHNVTEHARQLSERLNVTTARQIEDVKQRVQVMEDNSLLLQIDLTSVERQLKSKTSKAERDVGRLTDDVADLKQKTRSLHKTLNAALTDQEQLGQTVNATSSQVQQLQMEVRLNVLDDWLPYNFDYMKTRTDCFGDQYVRKSGFKTGRLVGVVLCSNNRYKIFLGQSLTDTFKNIGDDSGMGEDHCQFVNARSMAKVKVSPFRTSTDTEPGYVRTHWGQEPRPELLNIIRPSPAWYECGVSIP